MSDLPAGYVASMRQVAERMTRAEARLERVRALCERADREYHPYEFERLAGEVLAILDGKDG